MLGQLVSAVIASADDETDGTESTDDITPTGEHSTPTIASSQSREATVKALLDERGGRMFQQDVVDNTDYSAATVSRLLTEMEADGQITRYRKDRRKVVAYPDLGPETVKHEQ